MKSLTESKSTQVLCATLIALSSACSNGTSLPDGALAIQTDVLASGVVGGAYSVEIAAEGGSGSGYVWSLGGGALPAGLTLQSAGQGDAMRNTTRLTGVPEIAGDFNFTVMVVDDAEGEASRDLTLKIAEAGGLTIVDPQLPAATQDSPFEAEITAVGGTTPLTWSVLSGVLPPGLSFAPGAANARSAFVRGTPTVAGASSFTVFVKDADGAEASRPVVLVVGTRALSITTAELEDAEQGASYRAELVATGGQSPYRWSINGALPSGLTLTGETGALAGTPTESGNFSFVVQVEDATGTRSERSLDLIVEAVDPVTILTDRLPAGEVAQVYSATVSAEGGAGANYRFEVVGSGLPPGLSLDSASGVVSGTPQSAGTFTFTVRASDPQDRTGEGAVEIVVAPGPLPLEFVTDAALGPAVANVSFQTLIDVMGGVAPYSWSINAGSLPPGLQINLNATEQAGISGVPTLDGNFTFELLVVDARGSSVSRQFTLVVLPPLAITTTALPTARACFSYDATIVAANGAAASYTWSISGGSLPAGLSLQPSTSAEVHIAGAPLRASPGTYSVSVQATDSFGATASATLSLEVSPANAPEGYFAVDVFTSGSYQLSVFDACAGQQPPPSRLVSSVTNTRSGTNRDERRVVMSPDGRKIAFTGDYDTVGSLHVYVADLVQGVAGAPVRVSTSSAWTDDNDAVQLKFSPDGSRLAFVADGTVDERFDLHVVDTSQFPIPPDSSVQLGLLEDAYSRDFPFFAFSPDSTRLAFGRVQSGFSSLWVADTTNPAAPPVVVSAVSESPEEENFVWASGNRLVFRARSGGRGQLYVRDLGTLPGAPRERISAQTASNNGVVGVHFGLAPDGQRVWYVCDDRSSNTLELCVTEIASPRNPRPVHAVPVAFADVDFVVPQPGGSALVVMGDLQTSNRRELFLVDLDGPATQSPLRISPPNVGFGDNPGGRWLRWSANGRWITYSVNETPASGSSSYSAAYVTAVTGAVPGNAIRISPIAANFNNEVWDAQVSPSGRWLVARGDMRTDGEFELYRVDLAAPTNSWQPFRASAAGSTVRDFFFSYGDELVSELPLSTVDVSETSLLPNAVLMGQQSSHHLHEL